MEREKYARSRPGLRLTCDDAAAAADPDSNSAAVAAAAAALLEDENNENGATKAFSEKRLLDASPAPSP